jgi:hypothetical protein
VINNKERGKKFGEIRIIGRKKKRVRYQKEIEKLRVLWTFHHSIDIIQP